MRPVLALIVAVAENGAIGKDDGMPWHISTDLKRFRALTLGKPMIMGRKTFESIGRALPGRATIVLSRDAAFKPMGVETAPTAQAALALAEARAQEMQADEISLVGGREIFAAFIDQVERMYVTFVKAAPPGDVFFPPIDWSQWREVRREDHAPGRGDAFAFTFVDFERRGASLTAADRCAASARQ